MKNSKNIKLLLSSFGVNAPIMKEKFLKALSQDENLDKKLQEIQEKLDLNREDAEFLVAQKMVSNHLYSRGEMGIDVLYSNGDTKSISQASDMFNLDLLSKKVSKFYFCYIK